MVTFHSYLLTFLPLRSHLRNLTMEIPFTYLKDILSLAIHFAQLAL